MIICSICKIDVDEDEGITSDILLKIIEKHNKQLFHTPEQSKLPIIRKPRWNKDKKIWEL